MKKILIGLLIIFLFFSYIVLGVVFAYKKQPDISTEYANSFNPDNFYSDQISCDRACVIEDNTQALLERLRMIEGPMNVLLYLHLISGRTTAARISWQLFIMPQKRMWKLRF